ncbi:MAG: hypothetical protein COA95_06080 [Methylophaga sp.]|nr:MAG: hypothetical protein COA95_06080 [Methylophaga sp.]
MINMKYILLLCISFVFLTSCGREEDLGAGYHYYYTSSIGRRIVKNGEAVVDTAVLGYSFNKKFIAVVRLVSERYRCEYKSAELKSSWGVDLQFIDQLEYYIIDKRTGEKQVFRDKDEFYTQAIIVGIKDEVEVDQDIKAVILNRRHLNEVDLRYCESMGSDSIDF